MPILPPTPNDGETRDRRTHAPYVAEEHCLPSYGNAYAAGFDLRAGKEVALAPNVPEKVGTGLRIAIPTGHVGLVCGRSGLAFKRGIWSFEGTIDEDYRGEIGLLLLNLTPRPIVIAKGERVAQLVVVPVVRLDGERVEELDESPGGRGVQGFGSTGER